MARETSIGQTCLYHYFHTSVTPGNYAVDIDLLDVISACSEGSYPHHFIFRIKAERGIKVSGRIETSLLNLDERTLVKRVGRRSL